jgi:YHS domain-containing protein
MGSKTLNSGAGVRIARRALYALGAGVFLALAPMASPPAFAFDTNSTSTVNLDNGGFAVHGYDPVAYFTKGKPTRGLSKFEAEHDGAKYRFATAENRDEFLSNPGKYAPAFGGFCAMGAVFDRKFDGDPKNWKIVSGKLYLNVNKSAQAAWVRDIPGNISKANVNWPGIRSKAPKSLQ